MPPLTWLQDLSAKICGPSLLFQDRGFRDLLWNLIHDILDSYVLCSEELKESHTAVHDAESISGPLDESNICEDAVVVTMKLLRVYFKSLQTL